MTNSITFEVLGKPEPAGSKRAFFKAGMKRPIVTEDNTRSKPWKIIVASTALAELHGATTPVFIGPVKLGVTFHLSRPLGHHGKKGLRPSAPRWPTVKPDTTKLLRCLEDALTGIMWRDDAQIVVQHVSKVYSDSHPFTVITVTEPP